MLRDHRHRRFHPPSPIQPVAPFGAHPRELSAPIHRIEKALLAVVVMHLVFLPWALGAMHVWSQNVSLGLSALSLALALRPRYYSEGYTDGHLFRLRTLPKLLRFPIFWVGLLFLAYILIQALNPAWEYVTDGRSWWLQGVSCVDWLPTGMRTPFAQASPWRSLMIYSSAWMTACAVWIGFTRRTTLRILLVSLAINAFLLALFGLVQRVLNADRIFWFWKPPAGYFVASFIYRNHAGAYFNLLLAVSCALVFWFYRRQIRRQDASSPAAVLAFFTIVIAGIVLYSYSRGATLLMIGFLAVVAVVFARGLRFAAGSGRSLLVVAVFGLLLAVFVGLGLSTLKTDRMTERMKALEQEAESGPQNTRLVVAQATWEMAQDQLLTGWGAGSFRFYFPVYQLAHPGIIISGDSHKRMRWEHAHDDYLELLAEVGAVGCGLLAAGFLYGAVRLVRLRVWRDPPVAILLLGCLVTMLHATIDFPFFNPAILITWCCLWPLMIRWLEIEQQRRAGGHSLT